MAMQAATANSMIMRRSSDPNPAPTHSQSLNSDHSDGESSPSTEAYVCMAALAATGDSIMNNRPQSLHLNSSTLSDVSLSNNDEEVQRAARHLQQFAHLLSSQTPAPSSSGDDADEDYEMDILNPVEDPLEPPPSSQVQRALPSKFGK